MSVSVSLNGLSYSIPATGETGWGSQVTSFLQAVGSSTLQKSGGSFTLTADADFGGTYGLKSAYFVSRTASAATAGAVRLARADGVLWRNQADGANLTLGVDSSNNLEWEGVDVVTVSGSQSLSNKTIAAPVFSGTATGSLTNLALTTPAVTVEAWQTPTLVNSWVDLAGNNATIRYRKLADGNVQIRGAVKSGSSGTAVMFTLPVGYRPVGRHVQPVMSSGLLVPILIETTGAVSAFNSDTENVDTTEVILDGIIFPTT